MGQVSYISVILPLKLEWEPCYSLPEGMTVSVGDRVRARFANKEYTAVVSATGINPGISPEKVRPIISAEAPLEAVLPTEIELWKQVAGYYLCSIGEVYKAAYPMVKVNLEEARAEARQKAVRRREKVEKSIRDRIERLSARLEKKTVRESETRQGTKLKESLRQDIQRLRDEIRLSQEALNAASEAVEVARKGICRTLSPQQEDRIRLTPAQEAAYMSILATFKAGKPSMLHGLTGSGKTEIYIRLAHESIAKGCNVLYLVPEIALSRQLEDRLYGHFGERLLTYHSGESAADRRNTAETLRNGSGHIVLGTRSALFLPLQSLGLIIVDEEHDSSYKQDSPAPRYNGRDTALMLHRIHDCNIILGSATPSLEEQYNCSTGRHMMTVLTERYHGEAEAETILIDTKAERRKRGMTGNFSRKLIGYINDTLANGEQVLILRSRRSWAPVLQCSECGEIARCPHCNVSMNMHKNGTDVRMTCHYCGHSEPYTGKCRKCSGALAGIGAGTQKIEEEASGLFPSARIARLDSDTTQNKAYENRVIRDFGKGDIDILIGTQIITKGFDFERLGLVAVISADSLLGIMDFRADEKALHLLEQFRGRCGRRGRKGKIVIQTAQPEHPVYQRLKDNHENPSDLMQERKDFGFPPYTRIIEITIKDIHEDRAERMAQNLAQALSLHLQVTGPYSPAVNRIADHYIRKIRLTLNKDKTLKDRKSLLSDIVRNFEKERKYDGHITIDVDPS